MEKELRDRIIEVEKELKKARKIKWKTDTAEKNISQSEDMLERLKNFGADMGYWGN